VAGEETKLDSQVVADYIINLMATQSFIGLMVLIENTQQQFSDTWPNRDRPGDSTLCQENRLQILDPNAKLKEQLICYVPQ
jgi:hypothetical protein